MTFWRRLQPRKPIKRKTESILNALWKMTPTEPSSSHPFLWGKFWISWEKAREHFLVMGSTGSGKTVLLRRLMQTVLPQIGTTHGSGRRALVYDSKKDMRSMVIAAGVPEDKVILLNPFDARSYAWDMAADVTSPPEATELANLLIPKENESQPFFSNTARSILRGVIEVLMERSPKDWTLRHILLICEEPKVLKLLLESHPPTKWLVGLMAKEQTWLDIKSTLDSHLYRFRYIAAGWHAAHKAGLTISIKQWLKGEQVLILGNDDNARSELDIINRLFFDKLAQLINSQTPDEVEGQQTWLFLDEVREAGKLNTLHSLLLRARSKNCAVVLGFQDVLGMEAVYGEKEARELLGCPSNLALLSLNATAQAARKWASEVVDSVEQPNQSEGRTLRGLEMSMNLQNQYSLKPLILPIRFYLLGRPKSQSGMEGIFIVPEHRDRKPPVRGQVGFMDEIVTLTDHELFNDPVTGLRPESAEHKRSNYLQRPTAHLQLEPWNSGDSKLSLVSSIFSMVHRDERLERLKQEQATKLPTREQQQH